MSQNPLAFSNNQPPEATKSNLKPQLAAALASLEVQLEQELARYRRTRPTAMRKPVLGVNPTAYSFETQPPSIPQAQTNSSPTDIQHEPDPSSQSASLETSANNANRLEDREYKLPPTQIPGGTSTTNSSIPPTVTENIARENITPENPPPENIGSDRFNVDEYRTSTNPEELSSEFNHNPAVQESNHELRSPTGSIVPAGTSAPPSVNSESAQENPTSPSEPDDYLESSEALLRSLTEPESATKSQSSSNNNSLLSPLGIGSMLLLLVASVILGIVLFRPQLIPKLSMDGLLERDPANNNNNNSPIAGNSNPSEPEITPGRIVPNLANEEFPEVNNPNDVVGLTPEPSPTAANPPASANIQPNIQPNIQTNISPNPGNVATDSVGETNLPGTTPENTPTTSTNSQPTPQPQPITDADLKPSANGLYQVVVANQGEETFANARKIVPDAYLSPDKKYIFVGAVSSKEGAKKLLTELQAKGLNARPYQP